MTSPDSSLFQQIGLEKTKANEQAVADAHAKLDAENPRGLSSFGEDGVSTISVGDLSIQYNQINTNVSSEITEIVGILKKADPSIASKREAKPGLLARLTGRTALDKVSYLDAAKQVDKKLGDVPELIQSLNQLIDHVESIENQIHDQQYTLKVHIVAGQHFLSTLPEHQVSGQGHYGERSPGDRLSDRLTQLATLLQTNEQTIHQIKLLEQNSLSLIDHLNRIMTVTVPAWHARRMAIQLGDQDYEQIAQATESHQGLIDELNNAQKKVS